MYYNRILCRIVMLNMCLASILVTHAFSAESQNSVDDIITDNAILEKLRRTNLNLEQEIKNRELLIKKKSLEQELLGVPILQVSPSPVVQKETAHGEGNAGNKKDLAGIAKEEIQLSGILGSGKNRYVSLRVLDGTSAVLRIGESIAGWKVTTIGTSYVIVQRDNQTKKLTW